MPNFLGFHAQKQLPEFVAVNSECLWNLRSIIVSNEQFVSYYGIRHIISHETKLFTKKCIHRFNVAHCKSIDMKFENWTSIADGYVSCIHNS